MKTRPVIVVSALALCLLSHAARGAETAPKPSGLKPPTITIKNDTSIWPTAAVLLLALASIGVNMIPAKRGHQD